MKTVNFSPIIHVFEESGEDFFDKETLRDLRRSSEVGSCHEDWSAQDRENIKKALAQGVYEGQDPEDDEGG